MVFLRNKLCKDEALKHQQKGLLWVAACVERCGGAVGPFAVSHRGLLSANKTLWLQKKLLCPDILLQQEHHYFWNLTLHLGLYGELCLSLFFSVPPPCCAPWVLKHTSLAKELGLAQRTKSVLASEQQEWEKHSYIGVNHINNIILESQQQNWKQNPISLPLSFCIGTINLDVHYKENLYLRMPRLYSALTCLQWS